MSGGGRNYNNNYNNNHYHHQYHNNSKRGYQNHNNYPPHYPHHQQHHGGYQYDPQSQHGGGFSGNADKVAQHYNARPDQGIKRRQKSEIYHLRTFNNWVKSVMFSLFLVPDTTCLDICCGKGGDLLKWIRGNISHLVCVDIAEQSVAQCRQRFEDLRRRKSFTAEFHVADCTRTRLRDLYNRHNQSQPIVFDFVSCQFSIHYSFESEEQFRQILVNITECLRPNGVFICTTVNGCRVVKQSRELGKQTFGNGVYNVTFTNPVHNSDEDGTGEDKNSAGGRLEPFGVQYLFTLKDAVQDCPEYLVHFEVFERIAKEYKLELLFRKDFHEFFVYYKDNPKYSALLQRMNVLDDDQGIDQAHWDTIGLYTAMAFRKMAT
eukprot:Nk52_evm8s2506 gene=Nk52_evmTU8s2506